MPRSRRARGWVLLGVAVAVAASASGCLQEPTVHVPALTNGTVAEYWLGGTPGGYRWGTGLLLVDGDGERLFPTPAGGGVLVVTVAGPMPVIASNGVMEGGSEFRLEYIDQGGQRFFVGKQSFVPGKGVVGEVQDAWQATPDGGAVAWAHAWRLRGPDFLLATLVAGGTHSAGAVHVPIPMEGATHRLDAAVEQGRLLLREHYADGGNVTFAWSGACPLPESFVYWGPDGRLEQSMRLKSCAAGAGPEVGRGPGSPDVAVESLAAPHAAGPGPWFEGGALGGPDAAAGWAVLAQSPAYLAACPEGCALHVATRSEATKDVVGTLPVVTTRQHVHQWGFTVWDGSGGRQFVVEFGDGGPVVHDNGRVMLDRPAAPHGIGDARVEATIGRLGALFGPAVVEYRLQDPSEKARFVSVGAGELDQVGAQASASMVLSWQGPSGTLSGFLWQDPDL
jgi:hypothetical protein